MAVHDMVQVSPEMRAEHIWYELNQLLNKSLGIDRDVTLQTVAHWLDYHGAHSPSACLEVERVRNDALFWADCATDLEIDAYAIACLHRIERQPLASRANKRLAAAAFKNMSAEDRADFVAWIEKQEGN